MKFDFKKLNPKELIQNHYILLCAIISVILNIVIELLARLSFSDLFRYIITSPLLFLYNCILILATFCIALILKKRIFSISLISCLWVAAGITNSFLLHNRRTPFIAADFFIIKSAVDIMDVYMTTFQIILACVAIVGAITLLIILLIKERAKSTNYKRLLPTLLITLVISVFPSEYLIFADEAKEMNLTDKAFNYGFPCCFINSFLNTGIDKPDEYSMWYMKSILKDIDYNANINYIPEDLPNIIVLQLESFIDPYTMSGVEYSEDPTPNFRKIKENYSSGILEVSVYGGGTANTEFEVLTGMNGKSFGVGEYPYETVLLDSPVESACYNLKDYGYTSHALHNHTGTFYDRNIVYKNLGFDTFTSVEYMNNVNKTSLGWEKSDVFTNEVFEVMGLTENKDFVFVVTSQCHGKYPDKRDADYKIDVSGNEQITEIKSEIQYYVNELYDEDKWLGEFIDKLSDFDEPTMVILYGDHLPSFSKPEYIFSNNTLYQTEYAIWTNYPSPKADKDLATYELMAYALNNIDINSGIITQLHQFEQKNDVTLEKELKYIQYDMIYGMQYSYPSQKLPFTPANMRLGHKDIVITYVKKSGNKIIISGNNFTPSSVAFADGRELDTIFIDENTISVNFKDCTDYNEMVVHQKAFNQLLMSHTPPYRNPNK